MLSLFMGPASRIRRFNQKRRHEPHSDELSNRERGAIAPKIVRQRRLTFSFLHSNLSRWTSATSWWMVWKWLVYSNKAADPLLDSRNFSPKTTSVGIDFQESPEIRDFMNWKAFIVPTSNIKTLLNIYDIYSLHLYGDSKDLLLYEKAALGFV